jgi:hypothetical protein
MLKQFSARLSWLSLRLTHFIYRYFCSSSVFLYFYSSPPPSPTSLVYCFWSLVTLLPTAIKCTPGINKNQMDCCSLQKFAVAVALECILQQYRQSRESVLFHIGNTVSRLFKFCKGSCLFFFYLVVRYSGSGGSWEKPLICQLSH